MDSQTLTILIVAVVLAVAMLVAYAYVTRRRREQLRQRFGPEYDRTVERTGNPTKAEAILAKRLDRVTHFKLRPLSREQADGFAGDWQRIQGRFVDDPDGAVSDADALVGRVMAARGYPTEDLDRLADDVSVDHPHVVENYRTARALMARRASGSVQTEELRQAVVNYRALFTDLLEVEHHHHQRRAS